MDSKPEMMDYKHCNVCKHSLDNHRNDLGRISKCNLCPCDKPEIYVSDETRKKLIKIRTDYYSRPSAKYQIISQLKNREFSIITKRFFKPNIRSRFLYSSKFELLDSHFERFKIFQSPFTNLYYSVATYSEIPKTSYNLYKRTSEEGYKEFNENTEKYVVGYDIFFDIDNENIYEAQKDAIQLLELIEGYKVPYQMRFSGQKGFHIIISFNYVNWDINILKYHEQISIMIENIKNVCFINSIDLSIRDIKRVCKIAYSLDVENLCLPLNKNDLINFQKEKMNFNYVWNNMRLGNRGLLEQTYGLTKDELSNNLKKFIEYFTS